MKKQKQARERPTQGRGATFTITEMAVFTLETDYSCETGYPFDDSRQIGTVKPLLSGHPLLLLTSLATNHKKIFARNLETVATSSVYLFPLDYYFCAVRRSL